MSPVGAVFVLSPLKTGTNLLHPRSPQTLNDSPNNSSDLFIGLMRMRGTQSYTSVLVARWWLLLTPDGKVWGFGERNISVCPCIPETGTLENTCVQIFFKHVQKRRKKRPYAASRARSSTWPFRAGVLTQRFSTQTLELYIPRISRCTTQ